MKQDSHRKTNAPKSHFHVGSKMSDREAESTVMLTEAWMRDMGKC